VWAREETRGNDAREDKGKSGCAGGLNNVRVHTCLLENKPALVCLG